MSTDQEYWDACLIRAWRKGDPTFVAIKTFESITGKQPQQCTLLRAPTFDKYYPKEVRVFVANYLPKISAWLFKNGPERDVELLKKLSTSRYDCAGVSAILPDAEKRQSYKEKHKLKAINELEAHKVSEANSATDWGITKGKVRARRARG